MATDDLSNQERANASGSMSICADLTPRQQIALEATYQIEVLLDTLSAAARGNDQDRLDLLAKSLTARMSDLNSVVMSVLGDDAGRTDAECAEVVRGSA